MKYKLLKPTIVKAYEIDLISVYRAFENNHNTHYVHQLSKSDYLSRIDVIFEEYCKLKKINYQKYKCLNKPVKVSLRRNINVSLCGLSIIASPPDKIYEFLQYHYKNYSDKSKFIKIFRRDIYEFVKINSPFENKYRILQNIYDWVKEAKGNNS